LLAQARQNIGHDPAGYLLRGVKKAFWVWSYFPGSRRFREVPLIFWPLVGVQWALLLSALVGLRKIKERWVAICLVTPALAFTGTMFFLRAHPRFLLPAMLYLVMLAGQGFYTVARRFQKLWHDSIPFLHPHR